jgi:membrane protein YqaA with SNARE-associated domain
MKLYLLLFIAFILQEPITSNALLLEAYQYHYNIWIIHALFVIATMIDATIFYNIGARIHKKFQERKVVRYTKEKVTSFLEFAGKHGKRIALFIYGPIIFPLSSVIAPWIEISFWDSFIFLFLGDLLFWYGGEWLLVLGVKSFVSNKYYALYVIISTSVLISFIFRYIRKRQLKKHGNTH